MDYPTANNTAHAALTECSNMGVCNRSSGRCSCRSGFTGEACQRLTCADNCNGRGRCMSMRDAAAVVDGDSLEFEAVYEGWDADMIHGCLCDDGWEGHDCSLRYGEELISSHIRSVPLEDELKRLTVDANLCERKRSTFMFLAICNCDMSDRAVGSTCGTTSATHLASHSIFDAMIRIWLIVRRIEWMSCAVRTLARDENLESRFHVTRPVRMFRTAHLGYHACLIRESYRLQARFRSCRTLLPVPHKSSIRTLYLI